MKSKKIIQNLIIVVFAFVAGIMVGITLTNPGLSLMEATGTIGRVDQYRNVKITEADIELRNELLSDDRMREAYVQYLTFEYTNNIQMADNISYALVAADASPVFRTANSGTLNQMEDYGVFLDNVRLRILEAMAVISDLSGTDKVAIRTVLGDAGNAISQTITRSNAVFSFLTGVEDFFLTTAKEDFPQLVNAHDRLFSNMMAINMINDNRPVLEYLLAKGFLGEESALAMSDMESLRMNVLNDVQDLKAGFPDQESLQMMVASVQQLHNSLLLDGQNLQQMLRDGQTLNINALRSASLLNSESMMSNAMRDSESLRGFNHF